MHVSLGRRNPLHVDYLFLGVCLGHIQDALTTSILSDESVELQRRISIVKAIGKLIWIQNDLLSRWHVNEGVNDDDSNPKPPTYSLNGTSTSTPQEVHSSASSRSSSAHERGDTTSLGRKKAFREQAVSRPSSPSSSQCPFSGLMLDDQRAELRNSRPNSRLQPSARAG